MQDLKNKAKKMYQVNGKNYIFYDIKSLDKNGSLIAKLPYSIRILLESALRQCDGYNIKEEHVKAIAKWSKEQKGEEEVPFKPARVILQDFTGVPAVLDLASMRAAIVEENLLQEHQIDKNTVLSEFIHKINPEVAVDLVIDHSVQVDQYGNSEAFDINQKLEFERNQERYQFLNWAQKAFEHFTVVPPSTGIVHQVNLEHLASVVIEAEGEEGILLYPDTLVGTDSHTTMVNALGVLGWGVGGIEAEAGMLGQPSYFPMPEVIGVRLTGELKAGASATDLALRVTQVLRQKGVVGRFVEYFGTGMKKLSLADRATIANMAPEYGATCGFFPVDEETLGYLELTGRTKEHIEVVRDYLNRNSMLLNYEEEPEYTQVIDLDLSTIRSALSGPKRPQDYILLDEMKEEFVKSITAPMGNQGHGLTKDAFEKKADIVLKDGRKSTLTTGSVVIASITSCTNTSNPTVMLGAGLLAKKAVEKGLSVPAHVKTSLAPGSKVVSAYLQNADLQKYLDKLGFQIIGYGCATCIGNSGPLLPEISEAITEQDLLVTTVLSGNRNFEGRIHSQVKANYLASPILVVAYALAGTVNIDLTREAIGEDMYGTPVYLKDIWPTSKEIEELVHQYIKPELFKKEYASIYKSNELWNDIQSNNQKLYQFDETSTYIQKPPFFQKLSKHPNKISSLNGLRVLAVFGNSVTTDHISPAGSIGKNTPAGKFLLAHGVDSKDFNTYGSRRGNHEVMMRGTFANIRIRNQIAPGTEGGFTMHWPSKEVMPIYDACMKYQEHSTGLIVIAGKDYGMGSSRDWAAKGPNLLGVKAVIAESFERIHRSNLVMMGVLPLQFLEGENAETLGLSGEETFEIKISDQVKPREVITVTAWSSDDAITEFKVLVRFDSEVDVDYYRHGGILPMVLRQKIEQ
ncbi:MAG: aconitate hydratase [Herbinix sp.]|jgi:aconitate hydratase|nr:aconitate hydratase [Herbinix sp.]